LLAPSPISANRHRSSYANGKAVLGGIEPPRTAFPWNARHSSRYAKGRDGTLGTGPKSGSPAPRHDVRPQLCDFRALRLQRRARRQIGKLVNCIHAEWPIARPTPCISPLIKAIAYPERTQGRPVKAPPEGRASCIFYSSAGRSSLPPTKACKAWAASRGAPIRQP
jgi:hypothetical protein